MSTTPTSTGIEQHPDIVALRARSERVTSTPAAQAVEGLSLLTGVYIAASPWIVGFNGLTTLAITNLVLGVAFALLTLGWGSAFERIHSMSWAAFGIGVFTIIAPWAIAGNVDINRSIWSNVFAGGVAVVLALATAAMGAMRRRR